MERYGKIKCLPSTVYRLPSTVYRLPVLILLLNLIYNTHTTTTSAIIISIIIVFIHTFAVADTQGEATEKPCFGYLYEFIPLTSCRDVSLGRKLFQPFFAFLRNASRQLNKTCVDGKPNKIGYIPDGMQRLWCALFLPSDTFLTECNILPNFKLVLHSLLTIQGTFSAASTQVCTYMELKLKEISI